MIHRRVEKKLDRRRKLFVTLPKDILKRDTRESMKDERRISDFHGFSARFHPSLTK
jgi:hypothetical protein